MEWGDNEHTVSEKWQVKEDSDYFAIASQTVIYLYER